MNSWARNAKHLRDIDGGNPFVGEAPGFSPNFRGRLPLRPFAAAAASPARVRSIMVSRSSCAKAAMIVSIALPIGPSVWSPSVRLRNPMPRDVRNVEIRKLLGHNLIPISSLGLG